MHRFDYMNAFQRNLGIFSPDEQQRLRYSRVAIAGLGGAGGLYAVSLARAGVGCFTLADGDQYEWVNANRQIGCRATTVGQGKVDVIADELRLINPDVRIRVLHEYLDDENIDRFAEDADLFINAIDVFSVPAHRLLYDSARRMGRCVIFGAPLGFTCGVLAFSPDGMCADDYFDWSDRQDDFTQTVNLILGTVPAGLHLGQVDFTYVDIERHLGPSFIGACMLCAGVVASQAASVLLGRSDVRFAPTYMQFDPQSGRAARGRLHRGNRGPLQRIKRALLLRRYRNQIGSANRLRNAEILAAFLPPADAGPFQSRAAAAPRAPGSSGVSRVGGE